MAQSGPLGQISDDSVVIINASNMANIGKYDVGIAYITHHGRPARNF